MPDRTGIDTGRYLYIAAILALLVAGVAVRSVGVLVSPLDLWADEAWWATLLESRSLDEFGFRPIGYMWLCRQLLELGSPEIMLRLPSWLAGSAALVCIYMSAELLFRSRAAVLLVLLLAVLHPKLIVFAKEFKPYSVEVFVFGALTFWALRCLRDNRVSVGMLVATIVAIPFCYPIVFFIPALTFAFMGGRLTELRRFAPWKIFAATLVVVFLLLQIHFYLFESLNAAQNRWFWGNKYGVFPIDTGFFAGLTWYLEKTWSLLTLPSAIAGMPADVLILCGLACIGGGVMLLVSGRQREFLLLCVPLMAAALANLLGYWPYGAFRANLFLLPGALLLAGLGIDWLANGRRTSWVVYGMLAGVLLVASKSESATYRTKLAAHWAAAPQHTEVLDVIERRSIDDRANWTNVILADWHSWRPIAYYLRDYPALSERVRLVRGPIAHMARLEAQLAEEVYRARQERQMTRLWLVVTQLDPHRAIGSSELVEEFAVYRREFESPDLDYHPLLLELRF